MKAQWFGRYLLLDKVASGGMAEVWRAKLVGEANFQRILAIKKILPHVSEDPEFVSMFQDEANITVLLQHPNIGQVYEFSKQDDSYYISMEYISGKDLKTVWSHMRQRKQVIPLEMCCHIVQKMAEGLDYAHRKRDNFGNPLGIVHRDVSPQNCLVSWEGDVKVIDFGIAAAEDKASKTRAGTLKGKFAYMSPEQIRGLKLDGRADVFALGVVLYELVTGERGFAAESEFSLLEKVRNVEIKPPTMINREIPPELERIIFKALAKDRDERYQFGSDLAEDLQRYLLSRGKPPNAQSLGQFLRENFTVDYDKERLRLEGYREIEAEPPPQPIAYAPQATGHYSGGMAAAPGQTGAFPAAPPPGIDAVQAAMAQDLGAFSSSNPYGDSGLMPPAPAATGNGHQGTASGIHQGASTSYVMSPAIEHTATPVTGQRTNPGIAPPMQRTQVGVEMPKRPAGLKILIAAALALVLLVGGAVAALLLLRGNGTLIVTVVGASDGTVRIDGSEMGSAAPSLTLDGISQGQHTLIVEKQGYKAVTTPIFIEDGKVASITATLKRVGGRLRVTSDPSGAKVILDGQDTGKKTPVLLEDVESGTSHELTLQLEGYRDGMQREVQTEAGKEAVVRIALKPTKVRVTLLSDPPGADLKVDGAELGKTPVTFERDPDLSPPRIELKRPRCKPYKTTLPISADEAEMTRTLRLECR